MLWLPFAIYSMLQTQGARSTRLLASVLDQAEKLTRNWAEPGALAIALVLYGWMSPTLGLLQGHFDSGRVRRIATWRCSAVAGTVQSPQESPSCLIAIDDAGCSGRCTVKLVFFATAAV